MTQVCPQEECPCTIVCCEEQVAPQQCGDDRRTLRKFGSFCEDDSQDQGQEGHNVAYHGGGDKTHHRSRRNSESRRTPPQPPPLYDYTIPPPRMPAPLANAKGPPGKKEAPKPPAFCLFDGISLLIVIAYIFALVILAGALYYFIEDSRWNDIVMRRTSFPNDTLPSESFFSGSYLYLYENANDHLLKAKADMLRENRWLELAHIVYFAGFLLFTFMQLGTYLTRGIEDHSRIIILYYSVFGGLGIIVSLFPLLSWNTQQTSYEMSEQALRNFVKSIHDNPNSLPTDKGVTDATIKDAETLADVMKFCSVNSEGYSFSKSTETLEIFKRQYTLSDFQTLGLCIHYKFKITTAFLSFIFAFLCCAIPCVYCFKGDSGEAMISKKTGKSAMRRPPGPPGAQPLRPSIKPHHHHQHQHRHSHRHSREHQATIDELKKFKEYVEGDSDEQGLHHFHPDRI